MSTKEKVAFFLGGAIFVLYLASSGVIHSELDIILISCVFTLLFIGYKQIQSKYWPKKQETALAAVDSSGISTTQEYISFWYRETPLVSEEQLENGIYAVTDQGYVRAAVIFSFIMPGLGQSYNGQYRKGAVLTVAGLLLVWTIGYWALIIWLIGAADAYMNARKVRAGKLRKPMTGLGFFLHLNLGAIFMLVSVVLLTTFIKRG